ncbi:MAG: CorA family divalent cation transporter [Bacillota bacterium]
MMKNVLTTTQFTWLDIISPTKEELQKVAIDFGLHVTSVEDCLDPVHQPKYEEIGDIIFIIMRVYDESSPPKTNSAFKITRKIAIFYGNSFMITVHRGEIGFLNTLIEKWQARADKETPDPSILLFDLIKETVFSFVPALEQLELDIEDFEDSIFSNENTPVIIKEIHWFRARVSTIRHIFNQTYEVVLKFNDYHDKYLPVHQDIRERLERFISLTNALKEASNDILNTYLSLASHRTNEVIRVLTIFSVFFLPLTFLVGIYGMNFVHMPELSWKYGYPIAILVMGGITGAIYLWFKKRGLLK